MHDNPNTPIPINLKEQYRDRFKIGIDEAAFCDGESKKNPWYFMILCKYGDIYPVSDKKLGFHCTGERIRGRLHKEHPEIDVQNWSDDGEAIFIFDQEQFDIIADYAKPRRRRRLKNKDRQRLANAGRRSRFKAQKHGVEISSGAQIPANIKEPS